MTKVLGILFLCSVVINIYLLNITQETHNDLGSEIMETSDKVKVAQSAIKKIDLSHTERQKNLNQIKYEILEVEQRPEAEAKENEAKKAEPEVAPKQVWIKKIKTNLGLTIQQQKTYLELAKLREQELSDFVKSKVQANETFFYTLEDMVEENKINTKYLSLLIQTLGQESYEKYKKIRNDFNQEMIQKGESSFLVEL